MQGWRTCGSDNAHCASDRGKEGKEHWAITNCWRETSWGMEGIEGHSGRSVWPNENLGGEAWDFRDWKEIEECPPVHEVENIYPHRDSTITTPFSTGLRRQPHPSSPLFPPPPQKKLTPVLAFGLDNEPLMKEKAPKCQKCVGPHAHSSYLHALHRHQDRQRPRRHLLEWARGPELVAKPWRMAAGTAVQAEINQISLFISRAYWGAQIPRQWEKTKGTTRMTQQQRTGRVPQADEVKGGWEVEWETQGPRIRKKPSSVIGVIWNGAWYGMNGTFAPPPICMLQKTRQDKTIGVLIETFQY